MPSEPTSLGESARESALLAFAHVLDALQRLVAANLQLARVQMTGEAVRLARRALRAAGGLILLVSGYGLAMAALSVWLANTLGTVVALLSLGALNVAGGMLLFVPGARHLAVDLERREPAAPPGDGRGREGGMAA